MTSKPFSPAWEKRGSPRIQVGLPVLIPPEDQKIMSENISLKGCFLPNVDLGPLGELVTLKIDLPGFGFFTLETRIAHKGENNRGTGLEFIFMNEEAGKRLSEFLSIFSPDQ